MENKEKRLKIKDYPKLERPYERLEKYGSKALSDAELIAIIIKSGNKNNTSLDIARQILSLDKENEGISFLNNISIEEFMEFNGVGKVKALQIKAVTELGKRMNTVINKSRVKVTNPKVVSDYLMPEMKNLKHEELRQVLLNVKNEIIRVCTVSVGGVSSTSIETKKIFLEPLKASATSIILVHNHPTGNPTPSKQDITSTKEFMKGGQLLGINILDHIIIGNGKYISMREEKYI